MKKKNIPPLVEVKDDGKIVYHFHPGQVRAWNSFKRFIFIMSGSQAGKCNYKNTLIPIKGGERKKIKDITTNDIVLSIDDDLKIVESRVKHVIDSGILPTYELKTASGRQIIVSETHPFLTKDGWKEIKDINIKDFIAVPRNIPIEGEHTSDDAWLKLIGYLLGDGGISCSSVMFTNADPSVIEDFRNSLPVSCELVYDREYTYRVRNKKPSHGTSEVKRFLKRINMMGHTAHTKSIPKFVFSLKNKYVALVINRLFTCDGWVDTKGIGYTSVSKQMIYDAQHLLLRFGIVSRIRHRYSKCNGKMFPNYALTIVRKSDMVRFQEQIGIFSKDEKLAALIRTKETEQPKDLIPYNTDELYKEIPRIGRTMKMRHIYKPRYDLLRSTRRKNVERYKLQEIAEAFDRDDLRKLANSDIYWDQVKEIEYFGEEQCYDLEVEDHHNFIANDIFVHNTSFLPLWLHKEMQRAYLDDHGHEVTGIDTVTGQFMKSKDEIYKIPPNVVGEGTYLAISASFDLFKLALLPAMRNLFEQILHIGKYWTAARTIEIKNPDTGKFTAKTADDKMYARIVLRSAESTSGLESVTARAAIFDEIGMDRVRLTSWEALRRRLLKYEGRALSGTTLYNFGFLHDMYEDWRNGNPEYDVIQFPSTDNPTISIKEFENIRRTMPAWRFSMMFEGLYSKPAGMIFSDYDSTIHRIRPFPIPSDWPRHVGIDPGAVHTGMVWIAEDRSKGIFYVYRTTLDGNKTTAQHVAQALEYNETVTNWVGGAKSEGQFRMDWTDAGIRVQQPPISEVEAGIDRVISLFKTNRLFIFDTCGLLLDEIGSYSRVLDAQGQPTDVIKDKNKYHLADSLRYICSKLSKPPSSPATLSSSRFGAKTIPGFGAPGRSIPNMGVSMRDGHLPRM